MGHRPDEDRLQGRHQCRRQEIRGADRAEGQPVEPQPRGRGGERPDPERQGRAGAHRRHTRNRQPRERCVRTQRGALHLQRGAVAALVLRPQGRPGEGLQLDVSHVLGPRRRHRQLHQRLEDARHQQEGGRPVPERRRRQRLGRQGAGLPQATRADGLHAHRPWALPERHARFQRADRGLQERGRRDRHGRGDSAGRQDLPHAGAATGLQAEDHHARQGTAVPRRDRGAGRPGRWPVDRGVVEPIASVHLEPHAAKRQGAGRCLRGRCEEAVDAAHRLCACAVRGGRRMHSGVPSR